MAMLAEPKRKQKWTLNPRGKQWSEDSNKFGQKMLEKMGWTSGKGLGANEQGMTEHVRVRFKDDAGGIGYSKDHEDKNWTEHQENFNELLQNLQTGKEKREEKAKVNEISKLSGKSLELKSKQSRARVHYQKFTRGKDVNKYSHKDLANIFGKKDLSDSGKIEEIDASGDENLPPIGSADSTAGVLTIKGGSMNDYFKSKFPSFQLTSKHDDKSSESESERYGGFGFSSPAFFSPNSKDDDEKIEYSGKFTPKKRKSEFYVQTPKKIENNENFDANEEDSDEKTKNSHEKSRKTQMCERNIENIFKKKKKKRNGENVDHDLPEIAVEKSKKRKNDKLRIETDSSTNRDPENAENSSKFIFENQALDLESLSPISALKKSKKKRKKDRVPVECIPESSGSPKIPENPFEPESKASNFIFSNPALEINSPKSKKSYKKSKKSNIDDKKIPKNENFIFENPALDLNSPETQEKPKKRKNKGQIGYLNESTNFQAEENPERKPYGSPSVFEVGREPGLANEALDLTDEAETKRRVTFNDEIEYNSDFRKKKTRRKLDKFEVDNEKLRKKNAKKEADVQNTGFVNPALDVDVVDDEAVDNEENERKSKRERRKRRRISNLETIEEIPEGEKIEDSIGATPFKKRRRGDKERFEGGSQTEGNTEGEEIGESGECLGSDIVDEFESPRMIRTGKSKRILKNLFAKSPMLNFSGSNINDIRGYGIE